MNAQIRVSYTQNIHNASTCSRTCSHASKEENGTRNNSKNCKCKRNTKLSFARKIDILILPEICV